MDAGETSSDRCPHTTLVCARVCGVVRSEFVVIGRLLCVVRLVVCKGRGRGRAGIERNIDRATVTL